MYFPALALSTLLLAAEATAKGFLDISHLHQRRHGELDEVLRRDAYALLSNNVHKRTPQAPAASTTPASGNAQNFNNASWNATTTTACMKAIMAFNGNVTNPTGMALCYNLPFLNNTIGVFEAELRLYQVSQPTGAFAGVQPQDISVGLNYLGATISSATTTKAKRSTVEEMQAAASSNTAPNMLQAFDFVGQINQNLMGPTTNATALQALLTPTITLSSDSGASINLTSDSASFVNGVFANQQQSSTTVSPASASSIAAQAKKFVLPGVTLGIFPIGLIVTSSWTALFLLVVGYGTVNRIMFRDQYRRRHRRAEWAGRL